MVLLDAHRETTTHVSEPDWNAFVGELTLLCERFGVGIADEPHCFAMEPDDRGADYRLNAEGRLGRY